MKGIFDFIAEYLADFLVMHLGYALGPGLNSFFSGLAMSCCFDVEVKASCVVFVTCDFLVLYCVVSGFCMCSLSSHVASRLICSL